MNITTDNKGLNSVDRNEHRELQLEIVHLLYESNARSLLVSSLVAIILVYIESDVVASGILWQWSIVFVLVYGARYLLTQAFFRQQNRSENADQWLRYFRIATTGCGLTWGLAGYLFYQSSDIGYQAFMIFVLVGVSGGAIIVYAIDSICAALFAGGLYLLSLPSFLFPINAFSVGTAIMLGMYIIYVSLAGSSLARKLRDNILLRIAANDQEQAINALAQRQKLHIDLTPMGVIEWNSDGRVTSWNASAEEIFGYSSEEALQRDINFIVPLPARYEVKNMMQKLFRKGEVEITQLDNLHRDGNAIFCEWYFTPLRDANDNVIGLASLVQDKTEFRKSQEEIHYLAYYDSLTNLPNRSLLMDKLEQALVSGSRSGSYGGLLFLDLDNFKNLNDLEGHSAGDQLLKEVAVRLKNTVRAVDTISRFGGDEFVIILEELDTEHLGAVKYSQFVAEKIIKTVNQPYSFSQREHHTSCSIGICLFLGEELTLSELLKRADIAMFQAKQAGRNCMQLFDESLQPRLEFRATLESDLRGATFNTELLPYYQPQVDEHGRTCGAELLLRWRHPQHGMISPAEFIPIAEESNLINTIGHMVLEHACWQLKQWQEHESSRHLRLSVNISSRQFGQINFVEQVKTILQKSACPARLLRLELTESLMLKSIDDLVHKMRQLRAIGVSLSLDDFGTGYSSLSVLRRFPLNELKIDRSFVANMLKNPDDAVIISTIIVMGKNLGLEVVAEGVETKAQTNFLREAGCLNYQGYLFGRPMPINEFEKFLIQCMQEQPG